LQQPITIQVCKNKHCCKRATNKNVDVVQTMNNLLLIPDKKEARQSDDNVRDMEIVSSSCLSHCDLGPNVQVKLPNGTSILLHGMVDTQTCAAQLGELVSTLNDDNKDGKTTISTLSPPKILIAASKVMERSQQFPDIQERIRYLTSVIDKLESSPTVPSVRNTPANAHAHALRAQAYLEEASKPRTTTATTTSESDDASDYYCDLAIRNARQVVKEFGTVATFFSCAMAFRTWADAEQFKARKGKDGSYDYHKSIAVLKEWYQTQPNYRTKLQREIEDLLAAMK